MHWKNLFNALMITLLLGASAVLAAETPPAAAPTPAPVPVEGQGDFPVGEEPDDADSGPSVDLPEVPAAKKTAKKQAPADKEEAEDPASLLELEKAIVPQNYTTMAVLQGLNKITARTSPLEVPVGSSIRFGTIEILLKQCWKSSPDETPDSKALLEIWEHKPGEEKTQIFSGWMLASSPAVSALEHPVYDVSVIECKNK